MFTAAGVFLRTNGETLSVLRRSLGTLAFEEVRGIPKPPSNQQESCVGLVLHGLLGAGRNWRTVSRKLATEAAQKSGREYRLLLVDLRNHGASAQLPHFSAPHTMESAARDVINLINAELGAPPAFIAGHSLGGKVTMEITRIINEEMSHGSNPKQVWILDSQPGKVPASLTTKSDVDQVLEAIREIPLPVASREALYDQLKKKGFSLGLAQWLGSNLTGKPEGPLTWTFNVEGAYEMYESYKDLDCWAVLRDPPKGTTVNVVRASRSDRWNSDMIKMAETIAEQTRGRDGETRVLTLENAGHWLHADNPNGLVKLMAPSLVDSHAN